MGSWIECKDDKGHNVEQNKYNFLKAFADNKPHFSINHNNLII